MEAVMIRLKIEINEDIDHMLDRYLKKNKSLTVSKLVNRILENWLQEQDRQDYGGEGVVDPDKFNWDSFDLDTLHKNVEIWIEKYGKDSILENPGFENNDLVLIKDK